MVLAGEGRVAKVPLVLAFAPEGRLVFKSEAEKSLNTAQLESALAKGNGMDAGGVDEYAQVERLTGQQVSEWMSGVDRLMVVVCLNETQPFDVCRQADEFTNQPKDYKLRVLKLSADMSGITLSKKPGAAR